MKWFPHVTGCCFPLNKSLIRSYKMNYVPVLMRPCTLFSCIFNKASWLFYKETSKPLSSVRLHWFAALKWCVFFSNTNFELLPLPINSVITLFVCLYNYNKSLWIALREQQWKMETFACFTNNHQRQKNRIITLLLWRKYKVIYIHVSFWIQWLHRIEEIISIVYRLFLLKWKLVKKKKGFY